ncbi:MAG TPA: hypothetical protein VJ692_08310 [Nitrospiraceae bacterium]|nr:hypothetical protein [Nitrospiraceae bacterium]
MAGPEYLRVVAFAMAVSLVISVGAAFAGDPSGEQRRSVQFPRVAQIGPSPPPRDAKSPPPSAAPSMESSSVEDLLLEKGSITMDDWIRIKAEEEYRLAEREKRVDVLESWKSKIETQPILTDKFNVGLNALQFLYSHNDAHVPEGKSQDNFSIRRSEIIFWGKISEHLPRWHALFEFQSINLGRETPAVVAGAGATGQPVAGTFFRESYIDYRPVLAWAPNLNFIRMGIFRMPFGIFTETSGGLRDIISSPYLTSVGSGIGNTTGTAGTIDFLQERDLFVDARGRIANRLEYVAGIMNNNNFHANATGANSPKAFYSRVRFFGTDVSWVSFTVIAGESNNANTNINGRGKGNFDRYGLDFRYTSKFIPGLMVQGEWWQGHDGANQTTVGRGANGACTVIAICGGSGAPGVQRRTWYVMAKYLISEGWLRNWEPVVFYEQFDPSTSTSNDLYTRTIVGLTYYFENLPPKIQSKVQINYEFRHHQGNGPGNVVDPVSGIGDPFAQNAFLVQWQVRYM